MSKKWCPSAPPVPGSKLLGVVGENGRVGIISPPLPLTDEHIAALDGEVPPATTRLRFTAPCVERACIQWHSGRCRVAEQLAGDQPDMLPSLATNDTEAETNMVLPACDLRPHCRWYAQEGPTICHTCTFVVTTTYPHEAIQSGSPQKKSH